MKRRSRIEVNLQELDQIIDRATDAPLSKAESEKLKAALHAMAERLCSNRSTEKTSAVLGESQASASAQPPQNARSRPPGHGRNSAAEFTGAAKVAVSHASLKHGDAYPACGDGKIYEQKQPATLVRIVGRPPIVSFRQGYLISERLGRLPLFRCCSEVNVSWFHSDKEFVPFDVAA